MKTILIIIVFTGHPDGGVHTNLVEFDSLQACQVAATKLREVKSYSQASRVQAVCAPVK